MHNQGDFLSLCTVVQYKKKKSVMVFMKDKIYKHTCILSSALYLGICLSVHCTVDFSALMQKSVIA